MAGHAGVVGRQVSVFVLRQGAELARRAEPELLVVVPRRGVLREGGHRGVRRARRWLLLSRRFAGVAGHAGVVGRQVPVFVLRQGAELARRAKPELLVVVPRCESFGKEATAA